MNDEQFEYQMRMVEHVYNPIVVAALRTRDTAQREALARVEAKHATWMEQYDSVVRYGNELLAKHNTAQAQLAEVLGVLRDAVDDAKLFLATDLAWKKYGNEIDEIEARYDNFLARHAQAEQQEALSDAELMGVAMFEGSGNKAARRAHELGVAELPGHLAPQQQEAQGAQAGDERAAFERKVQDLAERFQPDYRRYGDAGEYKDATLEWAWNLWMARAALATQPAVTVEYEMDHVHQLAFEIGEPDDEGDGYYFSSEELEEFVEKLNTVRGAEHDQ